MELKMELESKQTSKVIKSASSKLESALIHEIKQKLIQTNIHLTAYLIWEDVRDSSDETGEDSCFRGKWVSEEEDEEEEEAVTAREAGPGLVSSAGELTAINLITVQQQCPRV